MFKISTNMHFPYIRPDTYAKNRSFASFPRALLTGTEHPSSRITSLPPVSYTHLDVYKRQGLNIALDLWFVAILHRGVAGAAEATVIAQYEMCIRDRYSRSNSFRDGALYPPWLS